TYYVIVVDAFTIRLAASQADATAGTAIGLDPFVPDASQPFGSNQSLEPAAHAFNPQSAIATAGANTIVIDRPHGFNTGHAVVYHNGGGLDINGALGGTSIGGLTDGNTYYVVKVDAYSFKLDAVSAADALSANPTIVPLDLSSALGADHTFELASLDTVH